MAYVFHGLGFDEADAVAFISPVEAPCLLVFITASEAVVVDAFVHFEIYSVYVDGIVHHAFVESVLGTYHASAL